MGVHVRKIQHTLQKHETYLAILDFKRRNVHELWE